MTLLFGMPNSELPLERGASGEQFKIIEFRQEKSSNKRAFTVTNHYSIVFFIFT